MADFFNNDQEQQQAIIKGLNFALQKFLSSTKVVAEEEKILSKRLEDLDKKVKQTTIKKVISNI